MILLKAAERTSETKDTFTSQTLRLVTFPTESHNRLARQVIATRDIQKNEELTSMYGEGYWGSNPGFLPRQPSQAPASRCRPVSRHMASVAHA